MADYYGTEADADAYHDARGNTLWEVADSETKLAGLLIASEWVDARYGLRWSGLKIGGRDQVREWPRQGVVDRYGYPVETGSFPRELLNATYEVALRQITNPGSLNIDYTPGKYKSVSVDGAVSVTFATFNGAGDVQKQMWNVDAIMAPLLTAVGSGRSAMSGDVFRT